MKESNRVDFHFSDEDDQETCPIWPVSEDDYESWRRQQDDQVHRWLDRSKIKPKAGQVERIPGSNGETGAYLLISHGFSDARVIWDFAALPAALPGGVYRIDGELPAQTADWAGLGWALGAYEFERYKTENRTQDKPRLSLPERADRGLIERLAGGVYLTRDLVNTPVNDMGPAELAGAARSLAQDYDGKCRILEGKRLEQDFPMIHAVGRASASAPRLIDLTWGREQAPKVTLAGKGVCFDTGGLNLKSGSSMELMKKDMGGAAHALGLARMIMAAQIDIRLRVLIPAVENSVSGNAFRPSDILTSRKGLSVEIGNTDAEGRLVLADALAYAVEEDPDLLIDFATLTGAARVALGPDLPAVFTDDDTFFDCLDRHAGAQHDPVWRMPLWRPYADNLSSKVADLNNITTDGFAGAITAALFLARFAEGARSWTHIDLFAWSPKARPGRPVGGEAYALRALYACIAERFG